MKKSILILLICGLFLQEAISQPVQNGCDKQVKTKVMLIGDSWASFAWTYKAFRESLRKYGHSDKVEDGLRSTMIGAQAESFLDPKIISKVVNRLKAQKDLEAAVIFLGGNDVMSAWNSGETYDNLDARSDEVAGQMEQIIQYIRAARPDIRIIVSSYDYPNFIEPLQNWADNPYWNFWEGLGYPTPYEANLALIHAEERRGRWCDSIGVEYLNNLGLMQYVYGQKDPLPVWPYDTYAPRSVPFPGGDPRYPTPHEAMGLWGIDAYHLDPEAYMEIANNCMRQFLMPMFRNNPSATYQSDKQMDGWVTDGGVTGSGELRAGVTKEGKPVKSILHFNTADIPDNATITNASLFVTRKKVVGGNPIQDAIFPGNAHIDIKLGSFGAAALEAGDYSVPADMEDAGCFVGQAYKNDFAFRVDIKTEALKYINPKGSTQFRIKIDRQTPNKNQMGVYYNGGETEPYYAPYLDVYYTVEGVEEVERISLKQESAINMYPNPAGNYLNIEGITAEDATGLRLFNGLGMQSNVSVQQDGENKFRIDTRSLSPGSYFIQIPGKQGKNSFIKL